MNPCFETFLATRRCATPKQILWRPLCRQLSTRTSSLILPKSIGTIRAEEIWMSHEQESASTTTNTSLTRPSARRANHIAHPISQPPSMSWKQRGNNNAMTESTQRPAARVGVLQLASDATRGGPGHGTSHSAAGSARATSRRASRPCVSTGRLWCIYSWSKPGCSWI